jgi:hypothetical protein
MPRVTLPARFTLALAALMVVACAGIASATAYNITWLDMSPTPVASNFPSGSSFNVPGIGNVTVTYGIPSDWTLARGQNPSFTAGNVVNGPNVHSWTNYEYVATIFTTGGLGPVVGTITFTFPTTLPAGSVYVGTIGLGRTSDDGTGASGVSTTRVLQNGTFLGDYVGDPTFGASSFANGPGFFAVQNSQTGPGGQNPWWNSQLGVVRVEDAVSSITVFQTALRGDGIGVNVGFDHDLVTPAGGTTWGRLKSLYR